MIFLNRRESKPTWFWPNWDRWANQKLSKLKDLDKFNRSASTTHPTGCLQTTSFRFGSRSPSFYAFASLEGAVWCQWWKLVTTSLTIGGTIAKQTRPQFYNKRSYRDAARRSSTTPYSARSNVKSKKDLRLSNRRPRSRRTKSERAR